MIKLINSYSGRTEWRIHRIIQEVIDVCCQLKSRKAVHVHQGANEVVHHFARWVAIEFSLGGDPNSSEYFIDLP